MGNNWRRGNGNRFGRKLKGRILFNS